MDAEEEEEAPEVEEAKEVVEEGKEVVEEAEQYNDVFTEYLKEKSIA